MALFEAGRPTIHVPIYGSDEVADVTGAGDTVIATMTLAIAAGASFYEAARLANYAGGTCRDEARHGDRVVRRALRQASHRGPRQRLIGRVVMTERELVEAVVADRAAGRTIAFANGCFDLLHVGHVRYLADAAAQADRLIVALNDDTSTRRLKGPGRPILSAADRAEMVAALESVDYVVTFSDPDVNRLLMLLKPDVHCKGTDYTARNGAGTAHCLGLRWPHRHRRRSKGSLHARSARAHQAFLNILIVRLGSLGDIIHAIPAAAAIRRVHPQATIHWLVDVRHEELLELVPSINTRVAVNTSDVGSDHSRPYGSFDSDSSISRSICRAC